MDQVLLQFGGGDNVFSWMIWIAFMVIFFLFYPRIMISQMMWKLERSARELERMSVKAKKIVIKGIGVKADSKMKESVSRFFEFFVIEPASLDPYGAVSKFDHIIRTQNNRFKYFVKRLAPGISEERQACIQMGLAGGMTVHEIAKIVRHYVELIKQTKSLQIAMILQMQLPLIERVARAMFKGTEALTYGRPIGDAIGPLVAAELMAGKKAKEIEEDIIMAEIKIEGRHAFVLRAKGPGGRLGYPGRAAEGIIAKNKVIKVITIDAAAKLEGEKTGSVAEGVGVAMGGPGVERTYIEDIVTKKGIPLDSIIVKMSPEQAIMPMRKAVKDAIPEVMKSIKRSLEDVKKGGSVLIMGVGNSSGIGSGEKEIASAKEWIDRYERKLKKEKKKPDEPS